MNALSRLIPFASLLALGPMADAAAPQSAGCGMSVPPGLVVNTTWTKASSPYCVLGDIQVSLLTIEPGVEVLVEGDFRIDVLSTITARGTSAEPIVFTSKDPKKRWKGIQLVDTQPGSAFEHCLVSRARHSGLRLTNSIPVIRHCLFEDNTSDGGGKGGGVWAEIDEGDLLIEDCELRANSAESNGGGMRAVMKSGRLVLVRCFFQGNLANPSDGLTQTVGGALQLDGRGRIVECTFQANESYSRCTAGYYEACSQIGRGGAVYAANGDLEVENCVFSANYVQAVAKDHYYSGSATARGGGLYYAGGGTLAVKNAVFGCNTAAASGADFLTSQAAGLYVEAGTAVIGNCTFARNTEHGLGAGGGTVIARNSIFFFDNGGESELFGPVTVAYCDVDGGHDGIGNIKTNPVFAGTGCSRADLSIVLGSACVDAGDPDPAYDDACFSASLGSPRNDMGASGGPLACVWRPELLADASALSVSAGGAMKLDVGAGPGFAGLFYLVLGSASGDAPGFTLGAHTLPLNQPDPYFGFTLANPNAAGLDKTFGLLSASGQAVATISLPAGSPPALAGLTLHHAYVLLSASAGIVDTSNSVRALLKP